MADRTCSEDGCDRPVVGRGLCTKHYQRWRKTAEGEAAVTAPKPVRLCEIEGCGEKHYGHGYCARHFYQLSKGPCTIEGCDRPQVCDGWCGAHYSAARRHGDPLAGVKRETHPATCKVDDCSAPSLALGLCQRHYHRKRRHGDPSYVAAAVPPEKQCVVQDCTNKRKSFDLCAKHLKRRARYNDLSVVPPSRTANVVLLDNSAPCRLLITNGDGSVTTALFDIADAAIVLAEQWQTEQGYVVSARRQGETRRRLHRLVVGLDADDTREPDHRNGQRSDNRRVNLRIVERATNCLNTAIVNDTHSSRFRNVYWAKRRECWIASVTVNGRNYYLGSFADEKSAAEAVETFRRDRKVPVGY